MGWFFGFKLLIVVNDSGEIIDFAFTESNADDRQPLVAGKFIKEIWGKLFGDRGCFSCLSRTPVQKKNTGCNVFLDR